MDGGCEVAMTETTSIKLTKAGLKSENHSMERITIKAKFYSH